MAGGLTEINIKADLPTSNDAIRRLTYHLRTAKTLGFSALKVIHGYGSTGKGGKIRIEARRYLGEQKQKGLIRDFITGEDFSIFDETTRRAFEHCPDLRRDSDLERHNNGITVVIL
ncbi:hypothetical protein IZU99_05520 [Oscillospiraceae bacterium CM]|nr:hypothetical protein IZU99_05520 [Oscillospiraceae bacterium CM]